MLLPCAAGLAIERLALAASALIAGRGRGGFVLLAMAGLAAIFVARSVLRSYLQWETRSRLLAEAASALVDDHGAPWMEARSAEAELSLLDSMYAAETLLAEHLPSLAGELPACACMVMLAMVVLPTRVVLESAAALLVGTIVVVVMRRAATTQSERAWETYTPMLDDLSAAARSADEIVANGTGIALIASVDEKLARWRRAATRSALTSFLAGRAPGVAVATIVGAILVVDEGVRGSMAEGTFARAALLASMAPPFAGLARAWLEIGRSKPRVGQVVELVDRPARTRSGGRLEAELPAIVTLDHVDFAYDAARPAVLEDIVATFPPGKVTAVAGANGSGKTTMLGLLLGLLEPTRGVVSIGGIDLSTLDRRGWSDRVGYLSQRAFLPARSTVREAMRFIAPTVSDDGFERVLREVRVWPALASRSHAGPLETRVAALSAGEKQRIALARVLARNPSMLLLDEPDANLDADGVELVASLLRKMADGRVVVVVAHSQRLISAADRVVELPRVASTSAGEKLVAVKSA